MKKQSGNNKKLSLIDKMWNSRSVASGDYSDSDDEMDVDDNIKKDNNNNNNNNNNNEDVGSDSDDEGGGERKLTKKKSFTKGINRTLSKLAIVKRENNNNNNNNNTEDVATSGGATRTPPRTPGRSPTHSNASSPSTSPTMRANKSDGGKRGEDAFSEFDLESRKAACGTEERQSATRRGEQPNAVLQTLPRDNLLCIFQFLVAPSAMHCWTFRDNNRMVISNVCRSWYEALVYARSYFVTRVHPLSGEIGAKVKPITNGIVVPRSKALTGRYNLPVFFEEMKQAQLNPRLKYISLTHLEDLTDQQFGMILETCPELEYLSVEYCPMIREPRLSDLSVLSHPRLRRINFAQCRLTDKFINELTKHFCPNLEELSLQDVSGVEAPEIISRKIVKLAMISCPHLQKLALVGCVSLQQLDLSANPELTDETISALCLSLPSMVKLRLSGCGKIASPVVASSTLRTLEAAVFTLMAPKLQCAAIQYINMSYAMEMTDEALAAICLSCPSLKKLVLYSATALQAPLIASQSLSKLDLSNCTNLTMPSIECPNLAELRMNRNENLQDDAVNRLCQKCPQLKHLDLDKCDKLVSPVIVGSHLRFLDLACCHSLVSPSIRIGFPNSTCSNNNSNSEDRHSDDLFASGITILRFCSVLEDVVTKGFEQSPLRKKEFVNHMCPVVRRLSQQQRSSVDETKTFE